MIRFEGIFPTFFAVALCACRLASDTVEADVRLPAVISNHMVLQQESDVPLWGWAPPGQKVSVVGNWAPEDSVTAEANEVGKWMVRLSTPKAGGPYDITIKGAKTKILHDVMIGEVWLCSGQSNMKMTLGKLATVGSSRTERDIVRADFPRIRQFSVGKQAAVAPVEDCEGEWLVCSPQTAGEFTAAGFYFGRELRQELNVPIGLILSAWGGTRIEAWTGDDYALSIPAVQALKTELDQAAKQYEEHESEQRYREKMEDWQQRVEKAEAEERKTPKRPKMAANPKYGHQNYPGNLYRGMIEPLVPYAIRGAIWYQGERNAKTVKDAILYRNLLSTMIANWRDVWGKGAFPFYFVQLPNYKQPQTQPVEDTAWAFIREIFMEVSKTVPNTGMVITIDIGEKDNIHPTNKQDVGKRLALMALSKTYGKDVIASGPVYKSMHTDGREIIVRFEHVGSGLIAKDGESLKTFAIAGKDRKFVWADARIVGDSVGVMSDEIDEPVALRYAWADNPEGCNLYNKEGLPASPFRTDAWEPMVDETTTD